MMRERWGVILAVGLVAAACGGGGSEEKAPLPAAPTALAGVPVSDTEILLGWTDNATNETGYRVERSVDDGATWIPLGFELAPGAEVYTDDTCAAPESYRYRVRALGAGGSSLSGVVTVPFDVAAAPTLDSATATSSTTIGLAWTNNASDAVGFTVYRSTDDATFAPVATLDDPTAVAWGDSALTPSTLYYYRVTASNVVGESVQSASASATTSAPPPTPPDAAPTGFAAGTPTYNSVPLTWACAATNESGFKIWRSTTNSFPGGAAQYTAGADATSLSATGLSSSTTYYFWIAATNAMGDNPTTPSTSVSATTLQPPPAAPSALTATYVAGTKITAAGIRFNWTDNSNNETGFVLQAATYNLGCTYKGISWQPVGTVGANVTTFFQEFGLKPPVSGTKICCRVYATNGSGNSASTGTIFTMP
jgi:hypothetical protein